MPSSVRDGVRPSAASMRAYSSAVRLCCFSSSAEMLAGEGTAGSVLVVMAINILSHDQRRLSVASTPPFPGAGKRRMEVKNGAEKAKGRNLLREGARCYPYFRRSGSAYQITTALPGIAGRLELSPSFPHSPVVTVVVRATSLPIASLVADSLVGHSVSLSFWKISLPLINKTPGRSRELSAFLHVHLWKRRQARTIARMCSGPVRQQPPIQSAPASRHC